jgi:uncharacterized protein (TIGR03083 family)
MQYDIWLATTEDNSRRLLAAAEAAGLDAPVPTCPGWDVAQLLGHLGTVQHWVAGIVAAAPTEPQPRRGALDIPDRPDRFEWMRSATAALLDALRRTPAGTPMWTMRPGGNVDFWARRQANEAAVHRVDAQIAAAGVGAGTVEPVAPDVAADAIDELLHVLVILPHLGEWGRGEPLVGGGETIHVHCTDVDGEWLVRFGAAGLEVENVHAKGDVAARGTASDLLLFLSGRGGTDRLEVFGDAALLASWAERVNY